MTAGRGIGRIGSSAASGNLAPSGSVSARARVMPSFSRGVLVGLILPFAVGMPLAGFGLQYVPDSTFIGTFARMLESAGPQIIVAALLPIAALALAGARRLAAGCLALCLLSGGALAVQQAVVAAPLAPAAPTDLRLLWFNADFRNDAPPDRILDAIRDSGADLAMLAESTQLGPHLDALADVYLDRAGCVATCEVLVLSRHPLQDPQIITPGIAWDERMAVFDLTLPGHLPVTFVALHMTKPWFYGIIDQEIDTVEAVLPQHPGPMVLAGDLNSAPWSLRLRWLRDLAGLRGTPLPVPTWPAPAGALGLPIDHVLVRGGPRVVSIAPWGTELKSDHRGLLAGLSLPTAP